MKISLTPEQRTRLEGWRDALRSEKYDQTTGTLRYENKFCCLGVLCDLSGLGEWTHDDRYRMPGETLWASMPGMFWFETYTGLSEGYDLAEMLEHEHQFMQESGGGTGFFSLLNDEDGYTFEQIAAVIDSILEKAE